MVDSFGKLAETDELRRGQQAVPDQHDERGAAPDDAPLVTRERLQRLGERVG
jgi:hypothetical protein